MSCSRKAVRESGPWGQSKNISLINLNHTLGAKEILLKAAYEQVSIGGGHKCAHGRPLDLEEMSEVEGEVFVSKDKLGELYKELSG